MRHRSLDVAPRVASVRRRRAPASHASPARHTTRARLRQNCSACKQGHSPSSSRAARTRSGCTPVSQAPVAPGPSWFGPPHHAARWPPARCCCCGGARASSTQLPPRPEGACLGRRPALCHPNHHCATQRQTTKRPVSSQPPMRCAPAQWTLPRSVLPFPARRTLRYLKSCGAACGVHNDGQGETQKRRVAAHAWPRPPAFLSARHAPATHAVVHARPKVKVLAAAVRLPRRVALDALHAGLRVKRVVGTRWCELALCGRSHHHLAAPALAPRAPCTPAIPGRSAPCTPPQSARRAAGRTRARARA